MKTSLTTLFFATCAWVAVAQAETTGDPARDFMTPPAEWKSRPLWFWNGPLDKTRTTEVMERSVASGYHGFGILPTKAMGVAFMSPEFHLFANSSDTAVSTPVRLRGNWRLERWDPHAGKITSQPRRGSR